MYKRIFEGKNVAIFDLDGTVVDSEYTWYKAFENVLKAVAPENINEAKPTLLQSGFQIIDKWTALRDLGLVSNSLNAKDLAETTKTEYIKLLQIGAVEVTKGFWEFAAELKIKNDYRLALTTNTSRNITNMVLKNLSFGETFDVIICGDEVTNPKPDPEIYVKTLKTLGVRAKNALVFEDSIVGAKASTKAGIDTVIIWDGRMHEQDYPIEVLGFVANFTPFHGNLDKSIKDIIKEYAHNKTQAN